jgi:hypothetical protein
MFSLRSVVAGALLALAFVAVGVALAGPAARTAGITGNNPVTACIHNGNDQLRVVADPSSCDGTPLSWTAQFGLGPSVGDVFTTAKDTVPLQPGLTTVATLNLPAGSYVLIAKARVDTPPQVHAELSASCILSAGDDADNAHERSGGNKGFFWRATLPLQLVHTFTTGGRATLTCTGGGFDDDDQPVAGFATQVKLTAIAVGKVTTE